MKYGLGMCLIATCLVCPAHADLVDFENAEDLEWAVPGLVLDEFRRIQFLPD